MRSRGSLGMLCLAALAACAVPRLSSTAEETPLAVEVRGPGLLFEVRYPREDAAEAGRIGGGLLAAGPRLSRWGQFRHGVTVRLLPDHDALEALVGLHGYPWLRAWAFGDQVLLQSPRSWICDPPAQDDDVTELLTHELTHALMYQLMQRGTDPSWAAEEPPLWFREGMASVTADQGRRRLSAEDLAHWATDHPGADLLRPDAALYREEKEAVYGAAHRAFDLLVLVAGDEAIRELLRRMSGGASFADAFRGATGYALADFEHEAIRSGFDPTAVRFEAATGAGGP